MKVKENTKVNEALKISKEVVKVFRKYDLDCPRCKGSMEDDIGKVAINHGLDLEEFLKEINSSIEKS